MIIFGTKSISKRISEGEFECPNCRTSQTYQIKRYNKYFHIFFIPLFHLDNLGDELKCQNCSCSYVPGSVLTKSQYSVGHFSDVNILTSKKSIQLKPEPADFGKRIGAYVIDGLCYLLTFGLIIKMSNFDEGMFSLFGITSFILYFVICEKYFDGASLGKKAMGIKVAKEDQDELSILDYIVRNSIKLITFFVPLLYFVPLFSKERKAIHDYISKTVVIEN